MMKLKTALTVLLAVCIFSAGARGNEPKKQEQPPAANAPEQGVVKTTITDLYTAYGSNDALADEKFTNRQVEVTGTLLHIRRGGVVIGGGRGGFQPQIYVLSMAPDRSPHVVFHFDLKDQKTLAVLKQQQSVTIRGQCKGRTASMMTDGKPEQVILISDCIIVSGK